MYYNKNYGKTELNNSKNKVKIAHKRNVRIVSYRNLGSSIIYFSLLFSLSVPSNCTQKAWPIEYTPNMELVGYQQNVIPNVADKWQCAQLCLTGTTQFRYGQSTPCYSAQYQSWSKTCTISSENRRTKPEAFGPSLHHGADYIENQCIAGKLFIFSLPTNDQIDF